MGFQRNITRILLLFLVFCLVVSFASAATQPGSPQPGSNIIVLAYKGIISALGNHGPGPAPEAGVQDPAPVTTTPAPSAVTPQPAADPVEMAYLENVDCSVIDERVTTYRCKGSIRIRSGIYDEVQVIAKYPDNNTFESGIVSMGGSNITLKSFMLFPDMKYQYGEPAFFVRLDKVKYPVIMYGSGGTAYLNPPPAPVATRAPATGRPVNMPPPATSSADPASGATGRTFSYVLQGESGSVPVTLHAGVYTGQNSLAKVYTCVRYNNDKTPCTEEETREYYLKYLDEPTQVQDLDELVRQIRSRTQDRDDQARIAISLVQRIPYDEAKANALSATRDQRYPYQTLYDNTGVCSDKSLLLAYLLRELGYGVALFVFPDEKHMAVGIKSPDQYTYRGTGYAFVETTTPSIPTDADGDYAGGIKLTSMPQVIPVHDGISFSGISEEYQDALTYNGFGDHAILSPEKYRVWETLMWKYGMKSGSGKTFDENPADKPLCGDDGIFCNGECYRKCSAGIPQCSSRGLVCYT